MPYVWADVSIPPYHLVMISFSHVSSIEQGSAVTLYEGRRPPRRLKMRTNFLFPFVLSDVSVYLRYNTEYFHEKFLFRMMFTVHQVKELFCGRMPCIHRA